MIFFAVAKLRFAYAQQARLRMAEWRDVAQRTEAF